MKKRYKILFLLLVLALLCFVPSCAKAQNTTITATITDLDGTVWAGGTYTITFYNPNGNVANYKATGLPIDQGPFKGTLNGAGTFSQVVADNNQVAPSGTKWRISLCPNASAPCQVYDPMVITGATMNLTTTLSSILPGPRFPAIPASFGYADVEVSPPPQPGAFYFNVISQIDRTWNGSAWQPFTAGASAAGALTGNTLAANVIHSSLQDVGTLTSLHVNGNALFDSTSTFSVFPNLPNGIPTNNQAISANALNGHSLSASLITFCANITNGVVEATCLGADPTGVTDSTASIQSAIWMAWSNTAQTSGVFPSNTPFGVAQNGSGIVHLAKGKYKTTSTLFLPPHVVLKGDGEPTGIYSCSSTSSNLGGVTVIDYEPSSGNLSTYAIQNADYNIVANGSGGCSTVGGCVGSLITSTTDQSSSTVGITVTGTYGAMVNSIGICTNNSNGQVLGGLLLTGAPESSVEHLSTVGFKIGYRNTGGWVTRTRSIRNMTASSLTGSYGVYIDGPQFGSSVIDSYAEGNVGQHIALYNGEASGLTVDAAVKAFELGGAGQTYKNVYVEDGASNMLNVIIDIGTAIHIDGLRINAINAALYSNTGQYYAKIENIGIYSGNIHQILGTYNSATCLEISGVALTVNDTLPTNPCFKIHPTPTTSGIITAQLVDTTTGFQWQRADNANPYAIMKFTDISGGAFPGQSEFAITKLESNTAYASNYIQRSTIWTGFDTTDYTCLGVPGAYGGTGSENTTCQIKYRPNPGSANKAICWKSDGHTLGYCSSIIAVDGSCTCN